MPFTETLKTFALPADDKLKISFRGSVAGAPKACAGSEANPRAVSKTVSFLLAPTPIRPLSPEPIYLVAVSKLALTTLPSVSLIEYRPT